MNKQVAVQLEVSQSLEGEGVEVLNRPGRSGITFMLPGGMEAGKSVSRAYAARVNATSSLQGKTGR